MLCLSKVKVKYFESYFFNISTSILMEFTLHEKYFPGGFTVDTFYICFVLVVK